MQLAVGMRIDDLHKNPELVEAFYLPLDQLAAKHGWQQPWEQETTPPTASTSRG